MKRQFLRNTLFGCLFAVSAFAVWSWFRPYEWRPDPAARCTIEATLLTPDQSFFWVNVHVKLLAGATHEMTKPVLLQTAAGRSLAPADTTFAGADGKAPDEIWFKFWLENSDLAGPLTLRINDGQLTVKSTPASPDLSGDAYRNFTTHRW